MYIFRYNPRIKFDSLEMVRESESTIQIDAEDLTDLVYFFGDVIPVDPPEAPPPHVVYLTYDPLVDELATLPLSHEPTIADEAELNPEVIYFYHEI